MEKQEKGLRLTRTCYKRKETRACSAREDAGGAPPRGGPRRQPCDGSIELFRTPRGCCWGRGAPAAPRSPPPPPERAPPSAAAPPRCSPRNQPAGGAYRRRAGRVAENSDQPLAAVAARYAFLWRRRRQCLRDRDKAKETPDEGARVGPPDSASPKSRVATLRPPPAGAVTRSRDEWKWWCRIRRELASFTFPPSCVCSRAEQISPCGVPRRTNRPAWICSCRRSE